MTWQDLVIWISCMTIANAAGATVALLFTSLVSR